MNKENKTPKQDSHSTSSHSETHSASKEHKSMANSAEHDSKHGKKQGGKYEGGKKQGKTKTKTVKYKTNLKCQNCVDKVKKQLDDLDIIEVWTIDLDDPNDLLTVIMDEDGNTAIIETVFSDAGYDIELYED